MRRNTLFILSMIGLAVLAGMWIMDIATAGPIRSTNNLVPNSVVSSGTNIMRWKSLRNVDTTGYVTANDTTPDPNAMTWADTVGSYCALDATESTVTLEFYGYGDGTGDGDANGGSFDVNVYIVEPYGSWERIGSFTVAVGELELTHHPVTGAEINSGSLDPNESFKWGEGPFTDNLSDTDIWPSVPTFTGESNGAGRFTFDPMGAAGVVVLYDNITALTRVYGIKKGR